MALLTFYDQGNNELEKFPMLIQEASWIENRPGRLVFSIPQDYTASIQKYLRWGSRVSAQFDWFRYLWVGFVEPPRKWSMGTIVVNCRSMEYIFHYRRQRKVDSQGKLSAPLTLKGTSGSLVSQILNIANSKKSTLVGLGSVNMAGPDDRQETVNEMLDVHLRNIAIRTKHVWNVSGVNRDGVLALYLNYFPRADTVIDYTIEEGVNLETPQIGDILVEDGDVYNDVLGTGDEALQEKVLAYNAVDNDRIALYGLRQTIEQFPGNVQSATIKRNTEEFLDEHAEAIQGINPVLPYTEEVVSKLQLNSVFPIRLHSVGFKSDGTIGFDGYAPVRSLTIDEVRGRVSVIVGAYEI